LANINLEYLKDIYLIEYFKEFDRYFYLIEDLNINMKFSVSCSDIVEISKICNISIRNLITEIKEYNKNRYSKIIISEFNQGKMVMENFVDSRKIEYILHFTRVENLDSILYSGLIPRDELERTGTNSTFNDEYRYDNCKNALCCSVGHPNYKMFYSLRMNNPRTEWCVIGIKKDVLWNKDCAFCIENAASNSVTSISINQRKGLQAFMKLFDEIENKPPRNVLAIPDNCPTNPQAEILIFDRIEVDNIIGVVFQSQQRADEYKTKYNKDNFFIYHKAFFYPRKDYEHWR